MLLSVESYHSLIARQPSIVDLFAMPGIEDIDFEPVEVASAPLFRPADFS